MKKYLLPENGTFFKANLHCHSVVSDGKLTPERLKEIYKEKGYSIIAYTDHDVFIQHNDLSDENFLALNGYEMEIDESKDCQFSDKKTTHICFIALEKDNNRQVCYHRNKYVWGNALEYRKYVNFDKSLPDYERHRTPEGVSEIMKISRDSGFFVTYNHPKWSLESYDDYSLYEGMHAMEICNFGCVNEGYGDYNPEVYDNILRTGKRIYCIATDDNHNFHPLDSVRCDSFGGFTMIKADKLEYKTITNALLAGNFYASQGPLINSLVFEDGYIYINCSIAKRIIMNTGHRRTEWAENVDSSINEAKFKVNLDDIYVRITVIDKEGKPANTNAYFVDELYNL